MTPDDGPQHQGRNADTGGGRRVLFIAAFAPPWGGVGALRITKLLKYLPSQWHATLLCSDATNPEMSDPALLDEIPPDVVIFRLASPGGPTGRLTGSATRAWRAGRLRRILGWAKAAVGALLLPDRWILWSLRAGRVSRDDVGPVNVVVSTGPPHSDHLAGARIAGRFGVPFVMDLRDDWYGNPTNVSRAPWHGPLQRRLEAWTLRRASRVVVITDEAVDKLTARYPRLRGRVVSIPNGYDPADIPAPLPSRARADRPVTIAFVGTLRREQHVGRFFEAFDDFSRGQPAPPRLRFRGVIDRDVIARANATGSEAHVQVDPPIDHRAAVDEMARADVLLVFTGGGGGGTATMTGKLFEYLAVRRPILLIGPDGPAARIVEASGAGVAAHPQDAAGIKAALARVTAMAADDLFVGAPSSTIDLYDRRRQAEAWGSLLDSVVAGSGA